MASLFKRLRDTRAATAIEYGLIAALIAVAAIAQNDVYERVVEHEGELTPIGRQHVTGRRASLIVAPYARSG